MKQKSIEIQNQQQKPEPKLEWEYILEKYGLFAYHEYLITGKVISNENNSTK